MLTGSPEDYDREKRRAEAEDVERAKDARQPRVNEEALEEYKAEERRPALKLCRFQQ